jgi:hypothetical protein
MHYSLMVKMRLSFIDSALLYIGALFNPGYVCKLFRKSLNGGLIYFSRDELELGSSNMTRNSYTSTS